MSSLKLENSINHILHTHSIWYRYLHAGLVLEFGVAAGKSLRKIRKAMSQETLEEQLSSATTQDICPKICPSVACSQALVAPNSAGSLHHAIMHDTRGITVGGYPTVAEPADLSTHAITDIPRQSKHVTRNAGHCIVGFDSFQGLPSAWRRGFGTGRFSQVCHLLIACNRCVLLRTSTDMPCFPLELCKHD